ncbi:MAG: hypothetical protein NVS1B10_04580 [Candidatus Saccharimonadales bacterium]
MPAAITDLLTQATVSTRPTPTTVSSTRASSGNTLSCLVLTGWPTATAVHFITYKIDTAGKKIAGSQIDWKGLVSGTTITNLTLKAGTDTGNAIGDVVEAAPTAAYANDLYTWGSAHANEDGTLIGSAVRTALNQTAATGAGWTTLGYQPNTITDNGNRSYTCVFNAVDLTGTVSNGMRLLMTRTTAAPTKSTSLNGTSQYWNNTTPAGMTFTNNFVVSAWVKLSSYATGGIVSRFNGTSGWVLQVNASGQLTLQGYNGGSANLSTVTSYQSLPLNKWVHVASQLDMATFTATPTTSYIMIDGVDVPASVARGGTNPTALVQAGNLEVGSYNATNFFPGKIAQAAIYNSKVTEATITASRNQTLVGTETSLISAYSFNSNANDLNTANANNLTSQAGAAATATDSPYAQGAAAGTLEYGIITSSSFSTNTTLTVQVPEGSALPTTGTLSAVSYATVKVPYGFPAQRGKWRVESILKVASGASAAGGWQPILTWNINVPIGEWQFGDKSNIYLQHSALEAADVLVTLSTTTNSASDPRFVTEHGVHNAYEHHQERFTSDTLSLSAATVYNFLLNPVQGTVSALQVDAANVQSVISAECAYL